MKHHGGMSQNLLYRRSVKKTEKITAKFMKDDVKKPKQLIGQIICASQSNTSLKKSFTNII